MIVLGADALQQHATQHWLGVLDLVDEAWARLSSIRSLFAFARLGRWWVPVEAASRPV